MSDEKVFEKPRYNVLVQTAHWWNDVQIVEDKEDENMKKTMR